MKIKSALNLVFLVSWWFVPAASAQLPTNNLTPQAVSVMTGTNGVLLNPTNFFTANSNALNASVNAVAGSQSPLTVDVNASGHKLTNISTLTATNINATNFTGNFNGPASTATNAGTAMNASNLLGTVTGNQVSTPVANATNATYATTASNVTGIVSTADGGFGYGNTNWVASSATYDNGGTWGYPQYTVTVISNATYFLYVPGNGTNNDQGVIYGGDYSEGLAQSGLFVPGTNHIQLWADNPSTTVGSQLFLVTNASTAVGGIIGGRLYGTFLGSIDPLTTLSASTIQSGGGYINGTRLQALANGGNENFIISTNTANGSTLSIFRAGPSGYADVNFFTYNSTNVAPPNSPTLWFAVGVGASGASFPYKQPYFESYVNQYPIYYVGAGQIFGGFYSTPATSDGDWIWFQDGTTNTPMFRICRANKVITNYYNVICKSNVTAATFTGDGSGLTNLTSPISSVIKSNLAPAISNSTNFVVDLSKPVTFIAMATVGANVNFVYCTNWNVDTNYQEALFEIKGDGTHSLSFAVPAGETLTTLGSFTTNGYVPGASNGLFQVAVSRMKVPGVNTNTTYALYPPNQ